MRPGCATERSSTIAFSPRNASMPKALPRLSQAWRPIRASRPGAADGFGCDFARGDQLQQGSNSGRNPRSCTLRPCCSRARRVRCSSQAPEVSIAVIAEASMVSSPLPERGELRSLGSSSAIPRNTHAPAQRSSCGVSAGRISAPVSVADRGWLSSFWLRRGLGFAPGAGAIAPIAERLPRSRMSLPAKLSQAHHGVLISVKPSPAACARLRQLY